MATNNEANLKKNTEKVLSTCTRHEWNVENTYEINVVNLSEPQIKAAKN